MAAFFVLSVLRPSTVSAASSSDDDTDSPLLGAAGSLLEPITAPVSQAAAPVVDGCGSGVEAAAPVVEAAAPVVEAAVVAETMNRVVARRTARGAMAVTAPPSSIRINGLTFSNGTDQSGNAAVVNAQENANSGSGNVEQSNAAANKAALLNGNATGQAAWQRQVASALGHAV